MDIVPSPSIKDLKQEGSNVFSEASKRAGSQIVGNIELYEFGETARTTQCPTCLRHSKEGTVYCVCGECLIPSSEQTERIKNRIDIVSVRRQTRIHGLRHGLEDWQYHHWKAKDATKNSNKREYTTIAKRWKDDPSYRETQQVHGWTLRILYLRGLPQHSRHQLRGYPTRANSIPQSIGIEVEIRKEHRKNVNS